MVACWGVEDAGGGLENPSGRNSLKSGVSSDMVRRVTWLLVAGWEVERGGRRIAHYYACSAGQQEESEAVALLVFYAPPSVVRFCLLVVTSSPAPHCHFGGSPVHSFPGHTIQLGLGSFTLLSSHIRGSSRVTYSFPAEKDNSDSILTNFTSSAPF